MRILLAEDNKDLRAYLVVYLERHGYFVTPTCDGQELLDYLYVFPKGRYHVIVTDNHMPKMTGVEALRRIKQDDRYRELPIIVYSLDKEKKSVDAIHTLGGIFVDKMDTGLLLSNLKKIEEGIMA